MFARRLGLTGLVWLCGALVCGCFPAFAAAAEEEHPYLAAPHSIIDQVKPEAQACGVVTDSHGDVYVADYQGKKVEVFSSSGVKLTEFTVEAAKVKVEPCNLAVDSAGGLYVDEYNGQVDKYAPSAFPPVSGTKYALEESAGTKGVIVPKSGKAHGVAVDPANQDLYVAEPSHIASYESTGKLISSTIGQGLVSEPSFYGVGVYGSNGDVYVADKAHLRVYVLNPSGTEILKEITGAGSPTGVFAAGTSLENLAVDQSSGDFYVYYGFAGASAAYEFTAAGGYLSKVGHEFDGGLAINYFDGADVAVDNGAFSPNQGDVYVTSQDQPHEADNVYAFGPATHRVLEVKKTGTGTGTVTSEPSGINCGGTCEALFEEGKKVTLTEKAETGAFAGWSGGGCSGTATTCEVTMTGGQFVTATFEPAATEYELKIKTTGSGTGIVKCEVEGSGKVEEPCASKYAEGTKLVLKETPGLESTFGGWSEACASAGVLSECKLTMSASESVTAEFTKTLAKKYALSVTVTPPSSGAVQCNTGSGAGSCAAEYAEGTAVKLTETPGAGYTFEGWSGACSGAGTCEVTMSEAKAVTAKFKAVPKEYALSVTVTPPSSGAVQCNTGSGAGSCAAEYAEGTAVKLTEAPGAGYTFEGWSGACTGTGTCELTMSEAKAVTAKFKAVPKEYALSVTVTPPSSGAVQCNTGSGAGSCAAEYAEGTAVKLTEAPGAGYTFEGWSGACTGTGTCELTMSEAKTVTAKFKAVPKQYALSVTVTPPSSGAVQCNTGSGAGSCAAEYAEGTAVKLTEAPGAGYTFEGWSGACTGTGTCELTMSEAKTVTAKFKAVPKQYALSVTVTPPSSGTVQCNTGSGAGACAAEYAEGTLVKLTETPAAGYAFEGWSGACSGAGTCEVTMSEAKAVAATFKAEVLPPTVTYKTCTKVGRIVDSYKQEKVVKGVPTLLPETKEVYDGRYLDKYCTEAASSPGSWDKAEPPAKEDLSYEGPEGKYELEAVRLPYHFAGKSGKKVQVGESEGKPIYEAQDKATVLTAYNGSDQPVATVTCKKLVSVGEITGETKASETIALSKCELPEEYVETTKTGKEKFAKVPCTSAGQETGTIETGTLTSTLVDVGGRVYERLTGEAEPFAQFTCQSSTGSPTTFTVSGSLLGAIESVAGKLGPLDAGAQAEILTFDPAEHGLSVAIDGGAPDAAGLESTETQKAFEVVKGELKGQLLYVEES